MDGETLRDGSGKFLPGTAPGPGRPRSLTAQMCEAAAQAITPDHIVAILRRVARAALEGNLPAARLVLERMCGRATEAEREPEPIALELPRMRTAADCDAAVQKIVDGIANGVIPEATAKLLLDAVSTRMKSLELTEHEQRLADLEKAAGSVELPGRR